MVVFRIAGLFLAALCGGCSSAVPRLHQPDRIEAYCGDRAAIVTAIESIVSSTGSTIEGSTVPAAAQIAGSVKARGGVIAHWNDQLLYSPALAKLVGADGTYVTLGDAAIDDDPARADSRRLYLTLKTAAGPKTFAVRAYDVQDVCNEGKLKS